MCPLVYRRSQLQPCGKVRSEDRCVSFGKLLEGLCEPLRTMLGNSCGSIWENVWRYLRILFDRVCLISALMTFIKILVDACCGFD